MKNNLFEIRKIVISIFCLLLELVVIKFNILFFTLPFTGIFYSFASIVIGSTYGAVIAFFSTIFMIRYNLLQLERLKIILHLNQISFLKIIFSLNQSLLFFQIIMIFIIRHIKLSSIQ